MREVLYDCRSREFAIAYGLLVYYLSGLSPIDLCLMKRDAVKINDGRLVTGGARKKTSVGFFVSRSYTLRMMALFGPFLERVDGEYLVPVMEHYSDSRACETFCKRGNSILRQVAGELGIGRSDELTYYCFRHSFASNFLKKSGNINALASTMGRSANTIATYVHQITQADFMAEELDKVF